MRRSSVCKCLVDAISATWRRSASTRAALVASALHSQLCFFVAARRLNLGLSSGVHYHLASRDGFEKPASDDDATNLFDTRRGARRARETIEQISARQMQRRRLIVARRLLESSEVWRDDNRHSLCCRRHQTQICLRNFMFVYTFDVVSRRRKKNNSAQFLALRESRVANRERPAGFRERLAADF